MFIRLTFNEEIDKKIWYAKQEGKEYGVVASNFTHYIVQVEGEKKPLLMGVLKRHAVIVEEVYEEEQNDG